MCYTAYEILDSEEDRSVDQLPVLDVRLLHRENVQTKVTNVQEKFVKFVHKFREWPLFESLDLWLL